MNGVAVMVEVTGALVLFVAIKEGTFPLPEAPKPMAGFELTQTISASGFVVKFTPGIIAPSFTVVSVLAVSTGMALTSYVNLALSAHSPRVGVKMYVPFARLSTTAGLQVPVFPLIEVVAKTGATDPVQTDLKIPKEKIGSTIGLTVTVSLYPITHTPDESGVN